MNDEGNKTILVVDDDPNNRELLKEVLEQDQYTVIEADNGEQTIHLTQKTDPDAILLDLIMPGMDGFEVCQKLKDQASTRIIPIIIVTSLNDRESKLKGIKSGADDFLTKPFDKDEVILKVKNSVRMKGLYQELESNYHRLEELQKMRDNLTHMIIHDMRQPVTVLYFLLDFLDMQISDPPVVEKVVQSKNILKGLIEMINSLLDIEKMEEGKLEIEKSPQSMDELIYEVMDELNPMATAKGTRFDYQNSLPMDRVSCDKGLVKRILSNLLHNAIKYTPTMGVIKIRQREQQEQLLVEISDEGPGIQKKYHQKVFEKFGQVEMKHRGEQYSSGLGLTFCKLAIEAHGGSIGVDSDPPKGSTFWFTLPFNN